MTRFLSCDWGSSSFRLADVTVETGAVNRMVTNGVGAAQVASDAEGAERDTAFLRYCSERIRTLAQHERGSVADLPVVFSGMVTSSYGWCEVPYATAPTPLDGSELRFEERRAPDGRPLIFVGGVRTPRDVMRGEEAQIMGLFARPESEGWRRECVVLMPGTHAKHVSVRDGRLVDFATFMTGEVFDVLWRHSVLRRSVAKGDNLHLGAFLDGVRAALNVPLLSALFRVRTNELFERLPPQANLDYLSGLLIGSEVAALVVRFSGRPIVLCGGRLSRLYESALHEVGVAARVHVVPPEDVMMLAAAGHAAFLRAHPELLHAR